MPVGGKDVFLSKVTFRRESNWYSKTKQILKEMESIEKRANELYPKGIGVLTSEGAELLQKAYIKGATEQKKIDLERMIAYVESMPQDVTRQDMLDGIIKAISNE